MQYGDEYTLNQYTDIIIYGAATTGAILYQRFVENGYNVSAFIDKRADEVKAYYGLPVFGLEQAKELFDRLPEAVVVVGVKNVFEHEKIAKEIWAVGCQKIIFRPYAVINGGGEALDQTLNQTYDKVLNGKFDAKIYSIKAFDKFSLKDQAIIYEGENETVIANIPVYSVWTDNYENKDIIWGNIPCLGLVPHIGLFRLFMGEINEQYTEYIKFCRQAALRSGGIVVSQAWEESVYKNRLDVFNHMKYSWEHDRDFFIRNVVEADYNEKGYFNIKSGKHRVVFFIVMGKQYIPLKIKKNDYVKWSNREQASEITRLLERYNRTELPVILESPYFYQYPCNTSDFYAKLLIRLLCIMYIEKYNREGGLDFSRERILLYNTPLAFYANVFKRIGFQVDLCEERTDNRELIDAVVKVKNEYVNADCESKDDYFLVVREKEGNSSAVNHCAGNMYTVCITNCQIDMGKEILSGFSENGIMYAFLQRQM